MHSDEASQIPVLKAKNPNLKVLVYKEAIATYSADWAQSNGADSEYLPAGVGYVYANTYHPEWFLTDTSGSRIEFSDFPEMWMMDWANPLYQQTWLQNVLADAKTNGWDGVLLDDVNWSEKPHLGGRTIAKYPTNADQQEAMRQFLAYVGPELTKNGLIALPNIFVESPNGLTIWKQWISYTSGGYQENWTKVGKRTDRQKTGADWEHGQTYLRMTQQAGKMYVGITFAPPTDTRSMSYALASFLLDWDGGPSALSFEPGRIDPWNPYWTTDLGQPSGVKFAVGSAWRRNYAKGTVLVNPTTTIENVELGAIYNALDGSWVSSVRLEPATAVILRSCPVG